VLAPTATTLVSNPVTSVNRWGFDCQLQLSYAEVATPPSRAGWSFLFHRHMRNPCSACILANSEIILLEHLRTRSCHGGSGQHCWTVASGGSNPDPVVLAIRKAYRDGKSVHPTLLELHSDLDAVYELTNSIHWMFIAPKFVEAIQGVQQGSDIDLTNSLEHALQKLSQRSAQIT
jgi:hypothetical protein